MTAGLIASIVGMIVSLALETIPGLKRVWTDWPWKRALLLGLFVLVPVVGWLLVCPVGMDVKVEMVCTVQELLGVAVAGLVAFTGSQTTYLVKTKNLPNAVDRKPKSI